MRPSRSAMVPIFPVAPLGLLNCRLFLGRLLWFHSAPPAERWDQDVRSLLKSGPWGELDCVPMTISAPEEMLPVRAMEESKLHWFFEKFTRNDLARLLDELAVPAAKR